MTTNAPRRRTRVRAAAAALGAALALTLTACQDDGNGDSDGAADQSPTAESSQEPGGDDAAEGTGGTTETGGTGDTGRPEDGGETGTGSGDEGAGSAPADGGTSEGGAEEDEEAGRPALPCTLDTTEPAASPVERPINHLLLTATNTGDEPCSAHYAPVLRLGDDAQAALPRNEDSKPQAVVTLAPGETAYAGILTSSAAMEGEGGYTATSLGVQFADAEDTAIDGVGEVSLPDGEVYVDNTAQVSYWQSSLSDALAW